MKNENSNDIFSAILFAISGVVILDLIFSKKDVASEIRNKRRFVNAETVKRLHKTMNIDASKK